jgi:hypothetical protein
MNKEELARIIEKSIKGEVKLSFKDGEEISEGIIGDNVMYNPSTMDPVIPVMVDTDNGLRKGFTITISQP